MAVGFFFWLIAARYYTVSQVGLGAALISSLTLILMVSRLGFDYSAMRFLPVRDKSQVASTCLTITSIASVVAWACFVGVVGLVLPGLSTIQSNWQHATLLLVFTLSYSVASVLMTVTVALRRSDLYLIQNVILFVRIPMLFLLAPTGYFGILASFGCAYLVVAAASTIMLRQLVRLRIGIAMQFLKDTWRFSSLNYISGILYAVPAALLPLIVLALLGDTQVAEYYISFSIVGLVFIIPMSLSTSLYVEGSHGENLRANARRVVIASFAIITPMIVALSILAGPVLAFFGESYKDATDLLRVFLMSSYFVAAYYIFSAIQNVRLKPGIIFVVTLLRFALIMGTSYTLMLSFGALGIGYAWLLSHTIMVLAILVVLKREKWI